MARFLLVLQSRGPAQGDSPEQQDSAVVLRALEPMLRELNAEIDHRTSAHLGALLKQGGESQRMQLFADVQWKPAGKALELVLISREAMGLKAPQTLRVFERLVELCQQHLQGMTLTFRSDRDGPLPPSSGAHTMDR